MIAEIASAVASLVLASEGKVLVATDYDGTLANIVENPAEAWPVDGVVASLRKLMQFGCVVCVVSGRQVSTLKSFLQVPPSAGFRYFGLYGSEIDNGAGLIESPPVPGVQRIKADLPGILNAIDPRLRTEDKGQSLVIHARGLENSADSLSKLKSRVGSIVDRYGLEVLDGKEVLEIRPPGMDKGQVVRQMLAEVDPSVIIYAGDDLGDVPAFREIDGLGRNSQCSAVSILVGASPEVSEKALASYEIPSPDSFADLLGLVASTLGASRGS